MSLLFIFNQSEVFSVCKWELFKHVDPVKFLKFNREYIFQYVKIQ